jgi:hypothetical protein
MTWGAQSHTSQVREGGTRGRGSNLTSCQC